MKVIEVIASRVWINRKTGQRVSPYGACPWASRLERADWEMFTVGFTWALDNGTIGLGRVPAKTMEEAVAVMRQVNGS